MGYSVRRLNDADYEMLADWWKAWRFPAPPRDFLPENGTGGILVSKDGVDVAAGFVYFTNSKVCWPEFFVSNFEVKDKAVRSTAITILLTEIENVAHSKGAKYLFASIKNKGLALRYKDFGFVSGSQAVEELIKVL